MLASAFKQASKTAESRCCADIWVAGVTAHASFAAAAADVGCRAPPPIPSRTGLLLLLLPAAVKRLPSLLLLLLKAAVSASRSCC
jgi:hypothetical protein